MPTLAVSTAGALIDARGAGAGAAGVGRTVGAGAGAAAGAAAGAGAASITVEQPLLQAEIEQPLQALAEQALIEQHELHELQQPCFFLKSLKPPCFFLLQEQEAKQQELHEETLQELQLTTTGAEQLLTHEEQE